MTIDPETTRAINTAARRMTDATPSPALRSRVMTRIVARPVWTPRQCALAGGAVGAFAIAVTLAWPRAVMPAAPDTPSAIASAQVVAVPVRLAFDDIVVVAAPVVVAMPSSAPVAVAVVAPDPAPPSGWGLPEVLALPPPDPITLSLININPLVVGPVATASGGGR